MWATHRIEVADQKVADAAAPVDSLGPPQSGWVLLDRSQGSGARFAGGQMSSRPSLFPRARRFLRDPTGAVFGRHPLCGLPLGMGSGRLRRASGRSAMGAIHLERQYGTGSARISDSRIDTRAMPARLSPPRVLLSVGLALRRTDDSPYPFICKSIDRRSYQLRWEILHDSHHLVPSVQGMPQRPRGG